MSFTVAYFARLELWWIGAVAIQGVLVLGSWHAWKRPLAGACAEQRHRMACIHFAALAMLPAATVATVHLTVAGMGAEISRASPMAGLAQWPWGGPDAWHGSASVFVVWLAGAMAMALRLAADAWRATSLRRESTPAEWTNALDRLGGGWAPRVTLCMADVTVPQVVGIRRPVLLAPRDLAARLPVAERDAVLLHELAHVHRRDVLWNLLQRLMLVLVWFQPVAWWLHRQLARERELCCDALAVRHGASPLVLGKALVRLAENRARDDLSMGIGGRGELTTRIHHLLGLHEAGMPPLRSVGMAVALSLSCLSAIGLGRMALADPAMGDLYIASAMGPTVVIAAHDPAGTFTLRVRQGRVIQASVDRRRIPREDIVQQGPQVTLVDKARLPIVSLQVSPQGRVRWQARPGETHRR